MVGQIGPGAGPADIVQRQLRLVVLHHEAIRSGNVIDQVHFSQVVACVAYTVDALLQVFRLVGAFRIVRFSGRFVTRAVIDRINQIALKCRQFEVDSTEFDDVTYSHHLLLVIGRKVLQNLIDGALLTNNEPHCPAQIDIVLVILLCLALCFTLFVYSFLLTDSIVVRYFVKKRLI